MSGFNDDLCLVHVVRFNLLTTLVTDSIQKRTLLEILWSDLTFKQQSSRIYCSAGTPVLLLSTLAYTQKSTAWPLLFLIESFTKVGKRF